MKISQTLVLIAAVAAVSWSAVTGAQQPPPKPAAPKPPAQQPSAGKQAGVYYDNYQASQRQRLRRESCMRDEDTIAQYCVKKCQPGYVLTGGDALPRNCRSEKPLPPGSLPPPNRTQQAIQPVPPPPSKRVPGA